MRINEFNTLKDFTSQYTGEWNPSENHWFGLDFLYNGNEYRLQTGSMYNTENTILSDGTEAMFGVYKKRLPADRQFYPNHHIYELLGEYGNMEDLLSSKVIAHKPFCEIILDASTELIGQD